MENKKTTPHLIRKYNIKAKKNFSQNFLINDSIIRKIIVASHIENENIIEIGPGLGTLTYALLENSKSVTAYEIDKKMIEILSKEITDPNFNLIEQDFLKANFDWKDKRKVVANIPYNITTDIVFKLIKNSNKFTSATLMVQKEFGLRMIAKPKTKEYGKLAVSLQSMARLEKITIVKNTDFYPAPKVDSIVIKIDFTKEIDTEYFHFILKCFSHKRKTFF